MELSKIIDAHGRWLRNEENGERANLTDADLRGADLTSTNLTSADLHGANLTSADLRGANLTSADLRGANLRGASLTDADLRGADLTSANLRGADLTDADLMSANLTDSNLRGVNLWGANLTDADLWSSTGNRNEIKSVFASEDYPITYTRSSLQIGCQRHAISDWWEFDDKRILEMDGKKALKFWREWKYTIRMIIEKSPATKSK